MTIKTYQIGDAPRCSAEFRNAAGTLIDPSTVVFKFTTPAGVVTTYTYPAAEVVKDGVGLYHVDLNANARGIWLYRWESTGTGQAAEQHEFTVEPG